MLSEKAAHTSPWYVLKTKNKKEKELATRLSIAHFEVYLPLIQGVKEKKPLFPSYLFIRMPLNQPEIHHMISYTHGVHHILGDHKGPQPIMDCIVEALQQRLGSTSREIDILFQEGEKVRIKKGVFEDVTGIIQKKLPDHERLLILYKWMNLTLQVQAKYSDLEKVA